MECIGSVVFPAVKSKPGPAARRGTVIHKFIEDALKIGRVPALEKITDEEIKCLCNAIDLNLFPGYLESEVTYEYDCSVGKARVIHIDKPRDYPYNDHCYYGTADLVGLSEDGKTVVIIDIKTGKKLPQHASENWQLKSLAVAAVDVYEAVDAEVALAYVAGSGEVEFEWARYSSLDLADFAEELSWLDSVAKKSSEAVASGYAIDLAVGDHCDWCPALLYCPAHLDPLRALADDGSSLGDMEQMTPAERGSAYARYTNLSKIVESIDASLRKMAKTGPLDLGDDQCLKYVTFPKTVVNSRKSREFVKWLSEKQMTHNLRPSIDDMSAEVIAEATDLGFITQVNSSQLRKVRK